MSRSFLIFGVALLALVAGALFFAAQAPVKGSQIAFALPDLDGVERNSGEWDGKHRILNFWATWCAPCRKEIPLLKAFQDTHGDAGIQVIGIAVDDLEPALEFAAAAEFNYPVLIGQEDAMAVAEENGIDFIGMPITMFVGREGELLGKYYGELHQEQLDEVATVLAELDSGEIGILAARLAINDL
ncbi:MAG: TlpA disulfide reductase family protein [Woeseiaceae bacterium]|nr:TlpA disulfide reductase family protein [Woeseiaceae bacterium]